MAISVGIFAYVRSARGAQKADGLTSQDRLVSQKSFYVCTKSCHVYMGGGGGSVCTCTVHVV